MAHYECKQCGQVFCDCKNPFGVEEKELSGAEQLAVAIKISSEVHVGQFDKSGQPYILHPLKVMHYLGRDADFETMCIAVLHDSIEDQPNKVTYDRLKKEGLSNRVIEGVRAVTKVPGETNDEYLNRICQNEDAIRVKLCDIRHNTDIRRLKGITEKDFNRVQKYHKMQVVLTAKLKEFY